MTGNVGWYVIMENCTIKGRATLGHWWLAKPGKCIASFMIAVRYRGGGAFLVRVPFSLHQNTDGLAVLFFASYE